MKKNEAFSLVEVVLALGVAAVAFTAIMGLFPLGLGMSRETHEETQAALIAQSILGDLRDDYVSGGSSHTNRRIINTNRVDLGFGTNFAVGRNTPTNVLYLGFTNHSLSPNANPNESVFAGAQVLRPGIAAQTFSFNPSSAPDWFQKGSNGLVAVARVAVVQVFRLADTNPSVAVLDVMVETPGTAASSNRTQYGFKGAFR